MATPSYSYPPAPSYGYPPPTPSYGYPPSIPYAPPTYGYPPVSVAPPYGAPAYGLTSTPMISIAENTTTIIKMLFPYMIFFFYLMYLIYYYRNTYLPHMSTKPPNNCTPSKIFTQDFMKIILPTSFMDIPELFVGKTDLDQCETWNLVTTRFNHLCGIGFYILLMALISTYTQTSTGTLDIRLLLIPIIMIFLHFVAWNVGR